MDSFFYKFLEMWIKITQYFKHEAGVKAKISTLKTRDTCHFTRSVTDDTWKFE